MHRNLLFLFFLLGVLSIEAQYKNFIDQPYIETTAAADTLVIPDRIYLGILLQESDTKGRTTLEELEKQMETRLRRIGIDLEKQLEVADLSSDFKKYFLRKQDVLKDKAFSLLVYDAATAGQVLFELEQIGVANVRLERTDYSRMEELQTKMRARAIEQARTQVTAMTEALGQVAGKAIYVSDSGTNIYNRLEGKLSGVVMTGAAETNGYKAIPSEFKKIRVQARVQVNFVLK